MSPGPELPKEELLRSVNGMIESSDAVLLGGSCVNGLAQASSDLDLFVIRVDGAEWSEFPRQLAATGMDRPVEVEVFSATRLGAVASTLQSALLAGDEQVRAVRQEVLVRYSAIITAIPLRALGDEWADVLGPTAAASYQTFAERWHSVWAEALAPLAAWLLEVGDAEAADTAARAFVAHALDGELVRRGELYFSPKYRFEKAARAGVDATLIDRVWQLHELIDDRPAIATRLREATALTGALLGRDIATTPVAPTIRPDVSALSFAGEMYLRRGPWLIETTEATAMMFEALERREPWEILASIPGAASAASALVHAGVLELPEKLGRWGAWV